MGRYRKELYIASRSVVIFSVIMGAFIAAVSNMYTLDIRNSGHIFSIAALSSGTVFLSFFLAGELYKRHEQTERLKLSGAIFQNTAEAIIVTDENTEIIFANGAFTSITGYSEEEVKGKKTSTFKSGVHGKQFYRNMWNSINSYGSWQGEVWDKKKNGQLYPKWLRINAIKGFGGDTKYIGVFEDLTDKKRINKRVKKLENYDLLTGFPNNALFLRVVQRRMEKDAEFGIVSIKITNFSILSESLGFENGQDIVLEFADRLRKLKKKDSVVARTGKDEFGIMYDGINGMPDFPTIAKELTEKLSGAYVAGGRQVYVDVAVGVASKQDSYQARGVLENANIAREYAIENGMNFFEFDGRMKSSYLKRIDVESSLRKALEEEEFVLYYQPQVNPESQQVEGAEALIRWESPELGRVSPAEFIPSAEKTGLMAPLGIWIIRQAVKQASVWMGKGIDINIAVNISPVQFKNTDIARALDRILKEYDFPGDRLEVEITEGLLIENLEKIDKQLKEIRGLGASVAIDDFGTGYSSLGYLKNLDIDKLKIDMQFIRGYPHSDDGTIAGIIANLAKSLKLSLTAEGVETKEQLEFVKSIGCDYVQGYYYSPPLCADDFEKLVSSRKADFKL